MEQLIDQAKVFFYYPDGVNVNESIQTILKSISSDRQKTFISSLFQELFYEQEQRRLYILNSLGLNNIDRDKSEVLIFKLNLNKNSKVQSVVKQLLPTTNIDPNIALSEDLLNQIQIFSTVYRSIVNYFVYQIANEKVKKLFNILKGLDRQTKLKIHSDIESFITEVGRAFDSRGLEGTTVSKNIENWIEQLGLNATYKRIETFGEKVIFLNLIDEIAARQLATIDDSNSSDEQMIFDVALLDYYQNPPNILDIS